MANLFNLLQCQYEAVSINRTKSNLNSLWLSALQAMKAFIEANFKMIDIDSDGVIGAKEFRYNCITRIAIDNIQTVDDAFDKLLDVITILIFFLFPFYSMFDSCSLIRLSVFLLFFYFANFVSDVASILFSFYFDDLTHAHTHTTTQK